MQIIALGSSGLLTWATMLSPGAAERNCLTAFSRIAQRQADKAIEQHQADAGSGLKTKIAGITLGIGETKHLSLQKFELCEDGPLVSANVTVRIRCSTGGGASIPVSIEDDVTAITSANLETCQVIDARISGENKIVRPGLGIGKASERLRKDAQ